jgi:predicted acyl esterase
MGGGTGRLTPEGKLDHGGRWRAEHEWPLARTLATTLFLRSARATPGAPASSSSATRPPADGAYRLDPDRPPTDAQPAQFTFDPRNPVPTVGGAVTGFYELLPIPPGMNTLYVSPRARMRSLVLDGPCDQRTGPEIVGARPPYGRLADRPDVLVFQTDPLPAAVEVTGAIEVVLWVSSSALDTDFTAKLVDVYPHGYEMLLVDSILRVRFRDGFDRERPLVPGQPSRVSIPLPPISNLFAVGHRIGLHVSSSNFPRFDVNPNTGEPLGRHTRAVMAENTVYLDRARASHIVLPVIPA